jgi:hypothetical protein
MQPPLKDYKTTSWRATTFFLLLFASGRGLGLWNCAHYPAGSSVAAGLERGYYNARRKKLAWCNRPGGVLCQWADASARRSAYHAPSAQ